MLRPGGAVDHSLRLLSILSVFPQTPASNLAPTNPKWIALLGEFEAEPIRDADASSEHAEPEPNEGVHPALLF
jgi:hypothetical protein